MGVVPCGNAFRGWRARGGGSPLTTKRPRIAFTEGQPAVPVAGVPSAAPL